MPPNSRPRAQPASPDMRRPQHDARPAALQHSSPSAVLEASEQRGCSRRSAAERAVHPWLPACPWQKAIRCAQFDKRSSACDRNARMGAAAVTCWRIRGHRPRPRHSPPPMRAAACRSADAAVGAFSACLATRQGCFMSICSALAVGPALAANSQDPPTVSPQGSPETDDVCESRRAAAGRAVMAALGDNAEPRCGRTFRVDDLASPDAEAARIRATCPSPWRFARLLCRGRAAPARPTWGASAAAVLLSILRRRLPSS